ncbi:adenylate cyclase type 10-like [Styela clava]
MAGKWKASVVGVESGTFQNNAERKLVSHVPDLVVFDRTPGKIPHVHKFDGVLLFADVSGFTALTEKYTQSSEKGTDALTVTLNAYIGKIVQNILQLGGDILKFAGDAILAVWKVTERRYLCYAISQAVRCSLNIQEKCDNQMTDVGVKLRVKIAISAGKIYSTFVGNEACRYFVMAGRPVGEVNAAEKYCAAGLVVLSPNALELAERDNIIYDPLGDRFGLVRYLRHDPRKNWHEYVDLPDGNSRIISTNKSIIRIALRLKPSHEREEIMRKYVTNVVQRKLDDNQPLKFLSEMRQCSIAFINMAFDLNERDRRFHDIQCQNMQAAFDTVYNCTSDMQGSLNKIFMFDKGCTFLVIFGLPGDKHEEEPANALQASFKICKELKQLPTLSFVSIGVTTGPVFCGVIGHEERHEYTVIGQKVNLAARLMMHYPGVVSCDIETFQDSKLSKDMFTKLPYKAMKGCGEVTVHEYTEGSRKPIGKTSLIEPEYYLIGREEEVNLFMHELKHLTTNRKLGSQRRVIVFEGEAGYGKSRVMEEIQWRALKEGVRVVAFPLSINDAKMPYFTLKTLIELLLGIQGYTDQTVREQALLCATNPTDVPLLCVLNDIIAVDFQASDEVLRMNSDERTRVMHKLVVEIVHKVAGNQFVMFALDDAQNIDKESWKFITTLSKDSRALCVLGLRPFSPDKPPCDHAKQILCHPKTMFLKLGGLPNDYMGALVCQILKVQRIPQELERLIIERSHGVPRWCEQLLQEMQKAGLILIVPLSRSRGFQQSHQTALVDPTFTKRNFDRETIYQPDIPFHQQKGNQVLKRSDSTSTPIDEFVYEHEPNQRSHIEKREDDNREDDKRDLPSNAREVLEDLVDEDFFTHTSSSKTEARHGKMGRMSSWADKMPWHKSSTTLLEFLKSQSKSKLKESTENLQAKQMDKAKQLKECIIKPGFDINKFPVPASIRGMALARLDRMMQYDQLIVKCAAVIGENFSRKMLTSVVPGYQKDKFQQSIFQLMRLRVFQCASIMTAKETLETQKSLGRPSHGITCDCRANLKHDEDDDEEHNYTGELAEEDIAARCEQLMFINSLVRETAYDLWLESQRKSLHEACACYLETKINEVLITGTTDDAIAKQFRLSKNISSSVIHKTVGRNSAIFSTTKLNEVNSEATPPSWKSTGTVPGGESTQSIFSKSNSSSSSFFTRKSAADGHERNNVGQSPGSHLAPPTNQGYRRRVSSSVIGRMNLERVGANKLESKPLMLKHDSLPEDYVSPDNIDEVAKYMATAKAMNVDISDASESRVDPETPHPPPPSPCTTERKRGLALIEVSSESRNDGRRMSYSPLWSQSVGLSNSYERLLLTTENDAKRLTGFQLNTVARTPYEMHDIFALLYPQLVHHWRKAANTQKTIDYLLKAGESCIATLLLPEALHFLEDANEIVQNLGKGNDIVAKVNEDDDDGGIYDVKVLSVSRDTKAQVQSLLGRILFQQGKLEQSLTHFLKALKIMRCGLSTNAFAIYPKLWYEIRKQNLHIKNPNRYVGKADSKLANKYVEQVRCLSYLWQIFLNLKRVSHRVKLAKLVAVMQVNRAEAADDDLQELITSYTYMMQIHQLTGDLQQSAFYENKATQRCLELPSKLSASDLYITGHLHLVSCSIRSCFGKLVHATTSGYRAYSVADILHDISIKLIVLPLLAQIHLLTGKGQACEEVLDLLRHISTADNDESSLTSFYCACMDLILDGGYQFEKASSCTEYLQNSESLNIGDVPRLYVRANMAVWCYRKRERVNGRAWLKLAEKSLPDFFDNFHSVRAFTRIVEARLIEYRGLIEKYGQHQTDTVKVERICRQHAWRLSKLCKQFPVFQPRYLHLKAYFQLLMGQTNKAREKVTQAANMARYCGNSIDRQWALHSQQLWFSPSSLTNDDINFWEYNYNRLPDWRFANKNDHVNRQFSLKTSDPLV